MPKPFLLYAPPEERTLVSSVRGVGEKGAHLLAESKFMISSVQELLQHYPRRHLDFSEQKSLRELSLGDEVTVIGEVKKVNRAPPQRRRVPTRITIADGTSKLTLTFFNQPWRAKQLKVGTLIAAKGKVGNFKGVRQMVSPLVDVLKDADDVAKIVPIYPATSEIHTAWLRRIIRHALEDFSPFFDPLPDVVRKRHKILDRGRALWSFHFPDSMGESFEARRRLVFDELFTLQCGLAFRKRRLAASTTGVVHELGGTLADKMVAALPFELTGAQTKAIGEIKDDMGSSIPMNRLLQGEVGSGKTVVALYAALIAVQGGYQAAIMAPTEVLAGQHFLTISQLLNPLADSETTTRDGQMDLFGGPKVVLFTGGLGAKARRAAIEKIQSGEAGLVVGTHALIQEGVSMPNLGLAVIDEQHRFGVHQRLALKEKGPGGAVPDVLIMTATPIPRTLALTLYGDLDVSLLDELPFGRRPVDTRVIDAGDRKKAYEMVREQVGIGHQAYVICPLVDESDNLEVKSAEKEAERLATEVFPDLVVEKIHGRLASSTKERIMRRFRDGEINVLISTTVVEVGVDVPNATVMMIEDADRFGLSQLHQLRGRIGRADFPSTCLLVTTVMDLPEEERVKARQRLDAVAGSGDGFELAEKDLEIRGAGTILGSRQAGWSDLRLTNLVKDIEILKRARDEAFALIEADPNLDDHPEVRKEMEGRFADRLDWLFHS